VLARQNAVNATTRERALIEAMIARYGGVGVQPKDVKVLPSDICGTKSTRNADPLDIVYAAHMRELAAAYPDDADIASLYAEAVMVATTDDWWNRKTGAAIGQIGVMASHLERVLQKHPDHTGLNHYLIHAMDSSHEPERALAAADKLGALAPMSPHLRHMPAHIYVRTARYGDAVRVNQTALASEISLKEKLTDQNFKVVKNWDAHNTHFLWFAAVMDGRADTAIETARRMAKRGEKGDYSWAEYQRSLPLLTLVRLQRWEEVLAEPAPKAEAKLESALAGYARAAAFASMGKLAEARKAGAPLEALVAGLKDKRRLSNEEKFVLPVVETVLAWQQAEIAMAAGDMKAAIAAATRGVEIEDTIESREPPILAAGSRTLLGQIYLKAQRWSDAEKTFREDLADQPGSGWALRGLTIALMKQGKSAEATAAKVNWERAWQDADLVMQRL
jgi:predicted Zn-dependent protease